jgi:choline dehydrogenase-like flavoprotein
MGSGQTFDVLVVGSGASGGWACKRLAEAGLKVALVDAGSVQSDANFTEHQPDFQFKYRNRARNLIAKTRPIQGGYAHEANVDWLANDLQEPYTTSPGMPFMWVARVRITGGELTSGDAIVTASVIWTSRPLPTTARVWTGHSPPKTSSLTTNWLRNTWE